MFFRKITESKFTTYDRLVYEKEALTKIAHEVYRNIVHKTLKHAPPNYIYYERDVVLAYTSLDKQKLALNILKDQCSLNDGKSDNCQSIIFPPAFFGSTLFACLGASALGLFAFIPIALVASSAGYLLKNKPHLTSIENAINQHKKITDKIDAIDKTIISLNIPSRQKDNETEIVDHLQACEIKRKHHITCIAFYTDQLDIPFCKEWNRGYGNLMREEEEVRHLIENYDFTKCTPVEYREHILPILKMHIENHQQLVLEIQTLENDYKKIHFYDANTMKSLNDLQHNNYRTPRC